MTCRREPSCFANTPCSGRTSTLQDWRSIGPQPGDVALAATWPISSSSLVNRVCRVICIERARLHFSLGGFFRQVLLDSELHDSFDQAKRNRLVEWKFQIALFSGVGCDSLLEFCIAPHRRIKPDVFLERREVDQNTVQAERRHLVADLLLRIRCCRAHGRANLGEDRLYLWRKRRNVLVDVLRRR